MEPKFQTSFIPKRPIVSSADHVAVVHNVNIFSIIATVLFIVTLATSGGIFAYKGVLNSQIAEADKNVAKAQDAFQPEKIGALIDANSRIISAKALLEKHVAVSELLVLLQSLTVKRMRFTSLAYTNKKGAAPSLSLDGEAATYNALAQEKDLFSKNEFMKNPQFSDFSLGENGVISVKFFSTLDPKLISYKQHIEASASAQ